MLNEFVSIRTISGDPLAVYRCARRLCLLGPHISSHNQYPEAPHDDVLKTHSDLEVARE